jgi:tRNA pseudouridine38-40 synthase
MDFPADLPDPASPPDRVWHGVLLTVAYDGGPFHGWAPQKDLVTVSGELLAAVQTMDRDVPELRGASRTDSGVHSRGQLVAFDSTKLISPTGWCRGLSSKLPNTISVRAARAVPARFSPRFSSAGKRYIYTVLSDRFRDPFHDPFTWRIAKELDIAKMRRAAASILGSHDFAAYRSSTDQRESTFRTLLRIDIDADPGDARLLRFTVEGTGFLHNMVRILVGSLADIGADKLRESALGDALVSGNRAHLGTTAPAQGLLLDEVFLDPVGLLDETTQPYRSPRGAQ